MNKQFLINAGVKLTQTRFSDDSVKIYIGKIAHNMWGCCVEQDGNIAQTGPMCKTKLECFSVLPEVAKNWGF